jgi:hypothetical protein
MSNANTEKEEEIHTKNTNSLTSPLIKPVNTISKN